MRKNHALKAIEKIKDYTNAAEIDIRIGQPLRASEILYELEDHVRRLADQLHLDAKKLLSAPSATSCSKTPRSKA